MKLIKEYLHVKQIGLTKTDILLKSGKHSRDEELIVQFWEPHFVYNGGSKVTLNRYGVYQRECGESLYLSKEGLMTDREELLFNISYLNQRVETRWSLHGEGSRLIREWNTKKDSYSEEFGRKIREFKLLTQETWPRSPGKLLENQRIVAILDDGVILHLGKKDSL